MNCYELAERVTSLLSLSPARIATHNFVDVDVAVAGAAVAVGAAIEHMPHRLDEYAETNSIVPGIKSLIALAVALTSHSIHSRQK